MFDVERDKSQDKLRSQIRDPRSVTRKRNPRASIPTAPALASRIRLLRPDTTTVHSRDVRVSRLKVGVATPLYRYLPYAPARARYGNTQGPPCTSVTMQHVDCAQSAVCTKRPVRCPLPDPIPSIETAPDIRTHARHPPAAAQNHSMLLSHCCWPRNGPLLRPSFWARRGGWASAPRGR